MYIIILLLIIINVFLFTVPIRHSPTCRWRLSSRPTWRRNRPQSGFPGPRSPPRTNRKGCRCPRSVLRTWRFATRSPPSSRRPSDQYRPAVRCTRDVPRPRRGRPNMWPTGRRRRPLRRSSTGGRTTAVKRTAFSWRTKNIIYIMLKTLCRVGGATDAR